MYRQNVLLTVIMLRMFAKLSPLSPADGIQSLGMRGCRIKKREKAAKNRVQGLSPEMTALAVVAAYLRPVESLSTFLDWGSASNRSFQKLKCNIDSAALV
jgi:hypothetical protein